MVKETHVKFNVKTQKETYEVIDIPQRVNSKIDIIKNPPINDVDKVIKWAKKQGVIK